MTDITGLVYVERLEGADNYSAWYHSVEIAFHIMGILYLLAVGPLPRRSTSTGMSAPSALSVGGGGEAGGASATDPAAVAAAADVQTVVSPNMDEPTIQAMTAQLHGYTVEEYAALGPRLRDESRGLHVILKTIPPAMATAIHAAKAKTVGAALELIRRRYASTNSNRRAALHAEIHTLRKKPDETTNDYFTRGLKLQNQLVAAGGQCEEQTLFHALVRGLPPTDGLVTFMNSYWVSHPNESVSELLDAINSMIIPMNDGRRMSASAHAIRPLQRRPPHLANMRRPGLSKQARSRPQQMVQSQPRRCYNCGDTSHLVARCPHPRRQEGGGPINAPASGSANPPTNVPTSVPAVRTAPERLPTTRPPVQPSQGTKRAFNITIAHAQGASMETRGWIVDSGATIHLCSDPTWLTDVADLVQPLQVELADKSLHVARQVGNVNLASGIQLEDVYYLPQAWVNLMSVPCSTDNGLVFSFNSRACVISRVNKGDTNVIGEAMRQEDSGLYVLQDKPDPWSSSADSTSPSAVNMAKAARITMELAHQRCGHISRGNLRRLTTMSTGLGLRVTTDEGDSNGGSVHKLCEACETSKMPRRHFASQADRESYPLEMVHSDVCAINAPCLSGAHYFVTLIDGYSGIAAVGIIEAKNDVPQFIMDTLVLMENQSGYKVKALRSDNGREYVNKSLTSFLSSRGIIHDTSAPYSPEQNGLAERYNRSIISMVRPMLFSGGGPLKLWDEAVKTAVYLKNRMPSRGRSATPYELFYGEVPDLRHLRAFMCTCYAHIPPPLRGGKLDETALKCVFVGYGLNPKTYRVYDPETQSVYTSSSVRFDENDFMLSGSNWRGRGALQFNRAPTRAAPRERGMQVYVPIPTGSVGAAPTISVSQPGEISAADVSVPDHANLDVLNVGDGVTTEPSTGEVSSESSPPELDNVVTAVEAETNMMDDDSEEDFSDAEGADVPPAVEVAPLRRSDRANRGQNPALQRDYQVSGSSISRSVNFALMARAVLTPETCPANIFEARSRPDAAKWEDAVLTQLNSVYSNNTFVIEEVPHGARVIPLKWHFSVKAITDEIVYKARLVAKGFHQREGIDYEEIFAPVARLPTVRAVIALATVRGWVLIHMDVNTAFLQGELKELVYVSHPPGFEPEGAHTTACRLLKPLYGLKQAPRAWNAKLNAALISLGFTSSLADPSLYVNCDQTCMIVVYVDDLLLAAADEAIMQHYRDLLMKTFDMKDLGQVRQYLGLEIEYDRVNRITYVSQTRAIEELLMKYGLSDCTPKDLPLSASTKVGKNSGEPLDTSKFSYASLMGSLLYISNASRPDITFAVNLLARYMQAPTVVHWQTAKGILRYLAGTKKLALMYSEQLNAGVYGYTDSDHAGDIDTRRSTGGYAFFLGGAAISWCSRRQKSVATSTVEAEFLACASAVKEALWLKRLLNDLGVTMDTVPLICDNDGTVKMLHNPIISQYTKHVDISIHFVREKISDGIIDLNFLRTEHMVADFLTKAVPKGKFIYCRNHMGIH